MRGKHMSKDNKNIIPAHGNGVVRIHLVDSLNTFLMFLVTVALLAIMLVLQHIGLFDNPVGSVISVALGMLFCVSVFDIAKLVTGCITIADGAVNAGKNSDGEQMLFHLSGLVRIELRRDDGTVVAENKRAYTRVNIAFVMESGRVNLRRMGRVTQKQLDKVRLACGK